MTSGDLIKKYLDFFEKRGHAIIPSAPLIPENDRTTLFISAGMHPLVRYLLGESHPKGKKLVDVQMCLRTDDINSVGDAYHHTFFEMLGNWSLGDYWKKESISWSYEFLTKELGISQEKLSITCFAGDKNAQKDTESAEIWKSLGFSDERIFFLPKKDNWWGPVGKTGPCGPDSEIFFDVTGKSHGKNCHPGDDCGRYFEIWNNVFMQYNKTENGKYETLTQRNVDTGMGVDRTTTILNGLTDDYLVKDLWGEIILAIENLSGKKYKNNEKPFRIIADHIRASVFIICEGVTPQSQDERGAILRRLLERATEQSKILGISELFLSSLGSVVVGVYGKRYPRLVRSKKQIEETLNLVEKRVEEIRANPPRQVVTLETIAGTPKENIIIDLQKYLSKYTGGAVSPQEFLKSNTLGSLPSVYAGTIAFDSKTTSGYPVEEVKNIAQGSLGRELNLNEFYKTFNILNREHQKRSRVGGEKLFKGGLADSSEQVIKLHTATHLLHAALRKVLGEHVAQKGSNITAERLRFDFSHPQKLMDEEIEKVEDLVNEQIKKDLPVTFTTMSLNEAVKKGALHFFGERYGKEVKVYSIGDFSKEVCGGPHVSHIGELGHVRIIKQEKVGAGIVRIYATTEK